MQLTDEKTNLIKRIIGVTGFATKKDNKKAAKTSESPAKQSQKSKGASGSGVKSAGKKKAAASNKKNEELEVQLFTINEPIEFP